MANKNGWIPCKEKPPATYGRGKVSPKVLVATSDGIYTGYFKEKSGWSIDAGVKYVEVFAWQKLPGPYREKFKLTDEERTICTLLTDSAKMYIARDNDNSLYMHKGKPVRGESTWGSNESGIEIKETLFPFIKFNEFEPWCVEELLEGSE